MWLWQDLRYAARGLWKAPGFTILATLALALGVGSVTTIFSVIQNVLLDPYPYADAQRIMALKISDPGGNGSDARWFFSVPEFMDYERENRVFDRVVGVIRQPLLYSRGGGTDRLVGVNVTPGTFELLGVQPLLGRALTPEDYKPGAPPVFVMSYKGWTRAFNKDPKILGTTLILNDKPRTLVGIMPPRFSWYSGEVWVPVTLSRSDPEAKMSYYMLLGHLKPGMSRRQASAEIAVLARRHASVYPSEYPKRFSIQAIPLAETVVGPAQNILLTLMGAVGMLLLIACVNVANMLLAKATARSKEIAIRSSLGATRWRLVRQFLAESFLLSLGAAIFGCLLAYAGLKMLVRWIPVHIIPSEAIIRLNPTVLVFAVTVSIATAIVFGLAPALHASKERLGEALKDTGKGVTGGFRHGRLRALLVISEITLSLVLLIGAGLLMRSFFALQQVDLGFDPKNLLTAHLPLPKKRYATVEQNKRFFSQLLARLEATPGIVSAAESSSIPPYGGIGTQLEIPGKTSNGANEKWSTIFQMVSTRYFETLGLRLMRGRVLSEAEVNDGRRVAVVNQALAKKFFPNEDPIGRRIRLNVLKSIPHPIPDPSFEIVGVVSDARNFGVQEPTLPEAFLPYTVTAYSERGILVRTAGDPVKMLETVRRQIWAVDGNVAITLTGSLERYLQQYSYGSPRFGLMLVSLFAAVGLLLVAIGVYSVLSYTVSRQTHEIGIRMALGAGAPDVLGMVFKMGLRLIGMGIVAGLLVSAVMIRILSSQIWGISPYDPVALGLAVATLIVVGLAACYFPARRAMKVDPVVALSS